MGWGGVLWGQAHGNLPIQVRTAVCERERAGGPLVRPEVSASRKRQKSSIILLQMITHFFRHLWTTWSFQKHLFLQPTVYMTLSNQLEFGAGGRLPHPPREAKPRAMEGAQGAISGVDTQCALFTRNARS